MKNFLVYLRRNLSARIGRGQKVIDIGSGHAPLIRADILCDLHPQETEHRSVSGVYSPPNRFVVGDVHELPFATGSFDFAYSRALLEHVRDPEIACNELARIAKRGLMELPSRLWEIMGGSKAHLWLIRKRGSALVFQRKTELHGELNSRIPEEIRNSSEYEALFRRFQSHFFIQHYWEGKIHIEIESGNVDSPPLPETPVTNFTKEFCNKFNGHRGLIQTLKVGVFEALRKAMGGRNIDLLSVLACPLCKTKFSKESGGSLKCLNCAAEYPIVDGVPFLIKACALRRVF
jgi:uncharacterized protein YbaR (Trm112 family)/SAM-dependent methyltransferase